MKKLETASFVVFGIGKRNAFLNLLKQEVRAHGLSLVGCDSSMCPPARFAVDRFFQIPKVSEEGYKGRVEEILMEMNAVGFMTLIDPEVPVLGQVSEVSSAMFVNPGTSIAVLCEDKFCLAETLHKAGVRTVPTFLEAPDFYSFIVKDRKGSSASGFQVVSNVRERSKIIESGTDSVFQPVVTGEHYCVDAYYSLGDGCLVDCCAKEVLSKSKGESYALKSVDRAEFLPMLDLIGSSLSLKGIVNLDIYRHEGELTLMEVNCRVGGNYPASHALGCNLIKPLMDDVLGKQASQRHSFSKYEIGAVVGKYFEFTAPQNLSD